MLKNPFSPRRLKKVQMQGGAPGTHPQDGCRCEAYLVRTSQRRTSARGTHRGGSPQMGLFQQPARHIKHAGDATRSPNPRPLTCAVHRKRKTPSHRDDGKGPTRSVPSSSLPRSPFHHASRRTPRVGQELAPRLRPLDWGCRGFFGPVPQPLWMRSMLLLLDPPSSVNTKDRKGLPRRMARAKGFPQIACPADHAENPGCLSGRNDT